MSPHRHLLIGTGHPVARALLQRLRYSVGAAAVWTTEHTADAASLVDRHAIGSIYLLTDMFPPEGGLSIQTASHAALLDVLDLARQSGTRVF